MLFTSIAEAVTFLGNMERPDGALMQRLMAVIYRLDLPAFELLVENILIKKYRRIAHSEYDSGYAEYACRWPTLDLHRAYTLFNPADFDAVIKAASANPHVGSFTIYAQEGFEPSPKELGKLAESGIVITYIGVQGLAEIVFRFDLIELIRDLAALQEPEAGRMIDSCLHSRAGQPGMFEAMDFLLRQTKDTEFIYIVHALMLRRGCIGNWSGTEFHGVDNTWQPFFVRAQPSPNVADFEDFYRGAIARQQTYPKLCAWFFHQSDDDPDFSVREAERDPDSRYGEIDSLKPQQLIHFFEDNAWLRRWLIHMFDSNGDAT